MGTNEKMFSCFTTFLKNRAANYNVRKIIKMLPIKKSKYSFDLFVILGIYINLEPHYVALN